MKWIVLSFFTLIFWVGLYLYIYLGFSKPVSLEITDFPAMTLVYMEHIGAYHKISPVIEGVERKLRGFGILCSISFGEYLDDPKKIEEDRLKSFAGCAFYNNGDALKNLPLEENGLHLRVLEPRPVLLARFQGSPSVGPLKVYPKMAELLQKKRLQQIGPTIELYEVQGSEMVTTYLQPVKSH